MRDRVVALAERIRELEADLEQELESRRKLFSYNMEQRKIGFARDIERQHKALKQKLVLYIAGARPLVVLTAPIIYSGLVPFILLDLFLTLYQVTCFPIYRIKAVKRADYIAFDRKYLSYLNGLEKLNCMYCSYGNGLLAYAVEVAAQTEKYWCPIKHAKRMPGVHRHYPEFLEYGDAEGYRQKQELSHHDSK
ncbi:hypothetical protein [Cohaesibacter celericrescens]|uniref:Uncharacterized protein n=1 Tax=Cohaesibacter celericrescens TaxID=2067669 RepID=A0A2N5XLE6_9HYPH|nr:hypothetical protein [Cohaesibacter celericrescens]PLW75323.1 hypothetical protein C0081_19815 [Cohaesibacter celericrescens]